MTSGRISASRIIVFSVHTLEGCSLVYRDRAGPVLVLLGRVLDRGALRRKVVWPARRYGRIWGGSR